MICGDDVDLSQLPPRDVKLKNCDWGIDDIAAFMLHPNEDKTVQGDAAKVSTITNAGYRGHHAALDI